MVQKTNLDSLDINFLQIFFGPKLGPNHMSDLGPLYVPKGGHIEDHPVHVVRVAPHL